MDNALLVIDMQNGFCHPGGSLPRQGATLAGGDVAVANAAIAIGQARAADVPVIFTRHVFRPGHPDQGRWHAKYSNFVRMKGLLAGSWDAEIVDELGVRADDLIVDKARFDAFQWTSLDLLLNGLGVRDLVVCGVVTNFCVETTIRSAVMRDYEVTVLEDCCASFTRRLHEIGVEVLRDCDFAEIASVKEGFSFQPA